MRPDLFGAWCIVVLLALCESALLIIGVRSTTALVAAFIAWLGGGAVLWLVQRIAVQRKNNAVR